MRPPVLLILVISLFGCSRAYKDLEAAFGVEEMKGSPSLTATTIVVTGPRHKGALNYRKIVDVYVSPAGIGIDVGVPFHKPLFLPIDAIAGCSMTCFGTEDQHVDLIVPSTGSEISIPSSPLLRDWCWNSRKPMISGALLSEWKYSGATLPPPAELGQFPESRDAYDKQAYQTCLGY